MPEITITVKCSNDTKYTMSVDTSKTVLDFKQLIAEKSDIVADRQRLIYSGRVLKDNDTLETYKIAEGHTVHMEAARESQTSQSTTRDTSTTTNTTNTTNNPSNQPQNIPPFGGTGPNPFAALGGFAIGGNNQYGGGANPFGDPNLGGANSMDQILGNPALMQYIGQLMQNPQFMDNVIAMNPQLGSMAPQLRQLTQDPEFQSLLSNPEAIRRMATLNSLMGNNSWGPPSTNNNNNDNDNTTPNTTTTNTTTPSTTNPPPINNPFLSLFNNPSATTNPNGNQNTNQQPPLQFDPSLLFGLGGLGGIPQTMTPQQPPEERFQVQLQQLNEMGFWDAQKNIRALLASGGNVNAAIELLLSDTLN